MEEFFFAVSLILMPDGLLSVKCSTGGDGNSTGWSSSPDFEVVAFTSSADCSRSLRKHINWKKGNYFLQKKKNRPHIYQMILSCKLKDLHIYLYKKYTLYDTWFFFVKGETSTANKMKAVNILQVFKAIIICKSVISSTCWQMILLIFTLLHLFSGENKGRSENGWGSENIKN